LKTGSVLKILLFLVWFGIVYYNTEHRVVNPREVVFIKIIKIPQGKQPPSG